MRKKSILSVIQATFVACVVLLSIGVIAQLESGLTKANECRHVAILPRHDKNEPYTARCFIPSGTIFGSRFGSRFSLAKLVDPEWDWVYKHNGTAAGQVVVRGVNSVTMISTKMCIDRGKTLGSPYRNYYSVIGNESKPDYPVGDFKSLTSPGDAYADCMKNPTQWYEFETLEETPQPLPPRSVQYIRRNLAGHFGIGSKLIPFNFSYSAETLDSTFGRTLKDALRGKEAKLSTTSGVPIVIDEYPFEIGLSIIGSAAAFSEKSGAVVQNIHHDLSALGWERALQARAALSGRINSAEEFPEKISRAELISFTVLTFLSIALYWQELRSCAKERAEEISAWNESTGSWVCVTAKDSHRYVNVTRIGTVRVVVALLTSIVSIVASVLIFQDSSLKFRKILRVTQGGVITYGKRIANGSTDPNNVFAGPEFSVAHWMEVHIETSGRRGLFPAVVVIAVLLGLGLIRMSFFFTLYREHHLDHSGVRSFLLFFLKRPILFLQTLCARLLPRKWKKIFSYEIDFKKLCRDIPIYHGQEPIEDIPARGLWKVLGRYNLDRFIPNHEADNIEPPAPNRRILNMNDILGTHADNRRLTRNEIQKAAEVIAANAHGMLSSIQALTLMFGHNLSAAADRYAEKGRIPTAAEVRGLARIWYIEEMVLLSTERQGHSPDNCQRIDMENHSVGARPLYTNELNPFSPVIGFRPNPYEEPHKLNDGVMYVTYTARARAQEQ